MNCETFEQNLELYLAGDLPGTKQIEMEDHIAVCAGCRKVVEQAMRVNDVLGEHLKALGVMTPAERVSLRENILQHAAPRSVWRQWWPRLAGIAAVLVFVLFANLLLPQRQNVSAADLITYAQAAQDEYAGLSGVLHWRVSLEEWVPGWESPALRTLEIWFDFDDPARYSIHDTLEDYFQVGMVRNGIDRMWQSYNSYEPGKEEATVDEIMLSGEEMQSLASWYVPSPFRNDLESFEDMVPAIKRVGKTTVAGRSAYLLRGKLDTMNRASPKDIVKSTVTLSVDAETYWLLSYEEKVKGETYPRTVFRTELFEVLPHHQVPDEAFTFTPADGSDLRVLQGIDNFYQMPRNPTLPLEQAIATVPFALMLPTSIPDTLQREAYVIVEQDGASPAPWYDDYVFVYRGAQGQQMLLLESMVPTGLSMITRPVEIGERQGWLSSDFLYAQVCTLHLFDWDLAERYGGNTGLQNYVNNLPEDPSARPEPGYVMLQTWGLTLDEAKAVMASLAPPAP